MSSNYAIISTEKFPIVTVTFTGEKATDDNFKKYLEELTAVYSKKEVLAIIFDATNAVFPGLKYQKLQADWLKENELLMKNYCEGTAYVISNALIRNVLKAIFKFQKQPVPYYITSNLEVAKKWVNLKLNP